MSDRMDDIDGELDALRMNAWSKARTCIATMGALYKGATCADPLEHFYEALRERVREIDGAES